jgi:acetylornithine aminotransferase
VLAAKLRSLPGVGSVRGMGLLIAVELEAGKGAAEVVSAALQAGLVVNAVTKSAIRLAPSLLVSDEEIAMAVEILGSAIAGAASGALGSSRP